MNRRDLLSLLPWRFSNGDAAEPPQPVAVSPTCAGDGIAASLLAFVHTGAAAARRSLQGKLQEVERTPADYGAAGDGKVDDYGAIVAAIAATPIGGMLRIKALHRITRPLLIDRQIDIACAGPATGFVLDVGVDADGVTFRGGADGLNHLRLDLNVYGGANTCRNALVFDRVDRSVGTFKVYAGAAQHAYLFRGCLINDFHLHSTINVPPPVPAVFQRDHMFVESSAIHVVSTNANRFNVNFEGGRHGVMQTASGGQGNNEYFGTIEGLSGRPFTTSGTSLGLHIRNMHLEGNKMEVRLAGDSNLKIGPGVINLSDQALVLSSCKSAKIDGYYGKLFVDATCVGTTLGQVQGVELGDVVIEDPSASALHPVAVAGSSAVMVGGPGAAPLENLFHNPFLDIWSRAGVPDGARLKNAVATRERRIIYPGNPSAISALVSVEGRDFADGMTLAIKGTGARGTDWISFMLPIYVPRGGPDVRVYFFDASQYHLVGQVDATDRWVVIRGSGRTAGAAAWLLALRTFEGRAVVPGRFFLGGASIVRGAIPPRYLCDSGRRGEHIVASVAEAPAFEGQRAYVAERRKWYMAADSRSPEDWIPLN